MGGLKKLGKKLCRAVKHIIHHPLKIAPVVAASLVPQIAPVLAAQIGVSTTSAAVMLGATTGAASATANHTNITKGMICGAITAGANNVASTIEITNNTATIITKAGGAGLSAAIQDQNIVASMTGSVVNNVTSDIVDSKNIVLQQATSGASGSAASALVEKKDIASAAITGSINGIISAASSLVVLNSNENNNMKALTKETDSKENVFVQTLTNKTINKESKKDLPIKTQKKSEISSPVKLTNDEKNKEFVPGDHNRWFNHDGQICSGSEMRSDTLNYKQLNKYALPKIFNEIFSFLPEQTDLKDFPCTIDNISHRVGDTKPPPLTETEKLCMDSMELLKQIIKERSNALNGGL